LTVSEVLTLARTELVADPTAAAFGVADHSRTAVSVRSKSRATWRT
jgi:hypothetical protein